MKRFLLVPAIGLAAHFFVLGQSKPTPAKTPAAPSATTTIPAASVVQKGTLAGNLYANKFLGFTIPLPDSWTIVTDEFRAYMLSKGIDVSPRPPKAADVLGQKKVDANFKRLSILATAYRSPPGTAQNSMIRIASEDIRSLNTNRPVKDAVDYVDLMRTQLASVKMPLDYKYSETQAEKLGRNQFAYIDTSDREGRTRIYVTVRRGYAVLFSLSFVAEEDLETFRDLLARADFTFK